MVLNPKGGSGKTTIATNLAAYYARQGKATVLLDHDAQGSSMRWLSQRQSNEAQITGIPMFEKHFSGVTRSFAQRIPLGTERIIVDTPASASRDDIQQFTNQANKILIPVLPSDVDIHTAARTVGDLLIHARVDRSAATLGVVANRVKRNTVIYRTLIKFLDTLDIPIAGILRDTQNYIHASRCGQGLHDMQGTTLHKDLAQWNRLINWVEGDRSDAA